MGMPAKLLLLVLGTVLYTAFHLQLEPLQTSAYVLPIKPPAGSAPVFEKSWVSFEETNEAHSASIGLLKSGQPVTVWYGGTEEGHADVALFMSVFNGSWSKPVMITDRLSTEEGLDRYIRKIGNPAVHVWPDGGLGIFYVSVSVGGWGASAINYIESPDDGENWRAPIRLVTSPFLNISTLVRTQALQRHDGHIELPVYHEFAGKFSESLVISRDIEILDKRRISWGKESLQPAIAPTGETTSLALLRYAGEPPNRILASTTEDTGKRWSTPMKLGLSNPNAAVALLNTGDGSLLLALNDTEDGRNRLSLATREADGDEWTVVKTLESETDTPEKEFEFSYPSLVQDNAGDIHLVYTWNQKRIRHMRFNPAWVGQSD